MFASDGSDIAQQWLTQDSINTKIDGMFDEEDYFALAALMKGLESDDSFDEMLNHIISKSSESIESIRRLPCGIDYFRKVIPWLRPVFVR